MNKKVIYAALMFVVTMSSGNASAQQFPYQNPALSAHERAVDLCGRLTLEEKASLMLDDSPAIPRLGIKRFQWWSEALHGVANISKYRKCFATSTTANVQERYVPQPTASRAIL